MELTAPTWTLPAALERVLGYLNFSSGGTDPMFFSALNYLYEHAQQENPRQCLATLEVRLREGLHQLRREKAAFADVVQAEAAIDLLFQHGLAGYRAFHQDLLGNLSDQQLFQPFFLGRFWECLLAQGGPWHEVERIIRGALDQLNDYVGMRPVAVLENRSCRPYDHERFRPIPLYIRHAGVAHGPYREIVQRALDILSRVPAQFTVPAQFDWDSLEELALDIRTFDFDHPRSRAPNYIFGMWDPHTLNRHGRYCRFVVLDITLQALWERVEKTGGRSREELQWEAGVVLAGTILMSSATCGGRPNAFDSTVTLPSLLQQVADLRDEYYLHVLEWMAPKHREYLRKEARRLRQPFGGARQHLNREIAHRRAHQLTRLHLARLFLRLGYPQAALQQAEQVGTASARMLCRLECALYEVREALKNGQIQGAAARLPEIADLLKRGIDCGALVDPWNILGLAAQFPLFGAQEAIPDHRVDDLVQIVKELFRVARSIWSLAAATHQPQLCQQVRAHFEAIADWWRQFAAHECQGVNAPDPDAAFDSAERVAMAMGHWYQGGAAAGDVAFWAQHVQLFPSAAAYADTINALLDRHDLIASRALLIHWLSRHNEISLWDDHNSFVVLAVRYLLEVAERYGPDTQDGAQMRWKEAKRFMELLEANGEELWQVPSIDSKSPTRSRRAAEEAHQTFPQQEEGDVFRAAYEDMIYVDQTDDGVDSSLADVPRFHSKSLNGRQDEIAQHLDFLRHIARLWTILVVHPGFDVTSCPENKKEFLARCLEQAEKFRSELYQLAEELSGRPLPSPGPSIQSIMDYDQQRTLRDQLVDNVVNTAAHLGEAAMWLRSTSAEGTSDTIREDFYCDEEIRSAAALLYYLRQGLDEAAKKCFPTVERCLRSRPLLYVPVTRGGSPNNVIAARLRMRIIARLLTVLPRYGMIRHACQLLDTARQMNHVTVGLSGAVTEFDDVFELGLKNITASILHAFATSADDRIGKTPDPAARTPRLATVVSNLRDGLAHLWLLHSRSLRLSVVEYMLDDSTWRDVTSFISEYGTDLFTQQMLSYGNIRGILHQGVENWLQRLSDSDEATPQLIADLGSRISEKKAARILSLILEAVCENYSEYRDYNSTTTYSDRGEKLFVLLDFLRTQVRFYRLWWNLHPICLIHQELARFGCHEVAEELAEEVTREIQHISDQLMKDLRSLQKKYSVEMATITDRMALKQQMPLCESYLIARVTLLHRASQGCTVDQALLDDFCRQVDELAEAPCGAGFEMPEWLQALDEEVDRLTTPPYLRDDDDMLNALVPQRPLDVRDAANQVGNWSRGMTTQPFSPFSGP